MKKVIIFTSLLLALIGCNYSKEETKLAVLNCEQEFLNNNFESAISTCTVLAKKGVVDAQFILGLTYYEKNSPLQSLYWLEKASDQGNESATLIVAGYYLDGVYVKKDVNKASNLYTKLSSKENKLAQFYLSKIYFDGNGANADYEKATELLTKSANHGYIPAQVQLGVRYLFGEKVEIDHEKALKWLTIASNQGDANAEYALGGMYYLGNGVKQNKFIGIDFFKKSAAQGNKAAINILNEIRKSYIEDHNTLP